MARLLGMVLGLMNSYRVLAALLALPWALLAIGYASGRLFYGELIHASGEWSIWLLILALAATPLRRVLRGRGWTAWLVARRRYLGVASFAYASLHVGVYLLRQADASKILAQAMEAGLLTGWLAFASFVPLALTSNDASVRRLGTDWKRLHRIIYPATALTFAHWIFVAFDPTSAFVYLGLTVLIELARFIRIARAE